jgi:hypothetical protein
VAFADTEFALAEKAVARRFVRDTPAVEQAWDVIKETKDHTVIRHFVDRFPSKQRRVVADTRLVALGQKPITVHIVAPQPLDADANVFAMAAADPDVLECFRRGDQTADACQRAVQRFPDIGHFAEDIRFTLSFCQAMGNPGGCVPTVKTAWNFPSANPGGGVSTGGIGGDGGGVGGGGTGTGGSGGTGGGTGTGGGGGVGGGGVKDRKGHPHPAVAKGVIGKGVIGKGVGAISGADGSNQHHHSGSGLGKFHASEALKLQQGGANPSTADVKATGIKATGLKVTGVTTGIKTPTINTPAVKTPDVKVNVRVPTPNIRVPTVTIR